MSESAAWCAWSYWPVGECADHAEGHPHRDVVSPLGPDDEPQNPGALVVVWPGDYRRQEVWVASGANVGNWYCLGNEFGTPKVWEPPARDLWDRTPGPPRPAGTVPLHPHWQTVIDRGPVAMLSSDNAGAYRAGWRNGRKRLHEQIESMAEDDSGADWPPR